MSYALQSTPTFSTVPGYIHDLDNATRADLELLRQPATGLGIFSQNLILKHIKDSFTFYKPAIFNTLSPPPLPLNINLVEGEKIRESQRWGEIFTSIGVDISEDSIYRKLVACIPLIGIIPTVLNERSLRQKITPATEPNYVIKLINIKNQYKFCSLIREVLSLALIVTGVALTILNLPVGIGAGMIVGGCMAFNAYAIHKNIQIMDKLQTNELPASTFSVR